MKGRVRKKQTKKTRKKSLIRNWESERKGRYNQINKNGRYKLRNKKRKKQEKAK